MAELKLRDYQRDAIDAVFKAWRDGIMRPAVVLPTGAGKTVVFAHLIKQWRQWKVLRCGWGEPKGERVIVLVHRDELADQAIAKIRSIAPDLNVGKVKAQERQTAADVMVCSVQTLGTKSGNALREVLDGQQDVGSVGLIITDECHHAAAASYKKVYAAFPDALQLGVTATMARGDGVGLGSTWDEVVYQRSILWMISKGYLTDVRAQQIGVTGLDMGSVKASRGDYQAGDLGRALGEAHADEAIARAYREHANDRPGVVFLPTVDTALATSETMNKAGIRTAVVHGETPRAERLRIFEDFRKGQTQVLVNCMVLTEGFDAPWASCAVIARPTQSAPLYTQMVGRVLRPWPGKTDALVLNLNGAGGKLRTLIDLDPGAVQSVQDGETLAEAVEREEKAGSLPAGSPALGLTFRDVDLFAASTAAWLSTEAGVFFIGCGSVTVFLWPAKELGLWDVCLARKGEKWQRSPHTGLDLSSALAWGEAVAEDQTEFSVQKSASWRQAKASDKQVSLAEALGIERAADMRRGELSNALSVKFASRQFDRFISTT